MAENKVNTIFPKETIKAYDGMSVTAEVWETAHSEHRDMMRAHILSMHRGGIICGLEVKANDPADHYVFITPGVAIDSIGRVIVVDQTIAYDFGDEGAGTYMLLLGYSEREVENQASGIKMMQHEYIIAARTTYPKQPTVELARVTLRQKGDRIRNAADSIFPVANELDLRFRSDDQSIKKVVRVGVFSTGEENEDVQAGWRVMTQELPRMIGTKLIVDLLHEINERITEYDMIYIYAMESTVLNSTEIGLIKSYAKSGKGLIFDGMNGSGYDQLKKIAVSFDPTPVDPKYHPIMKQPYFFKQYPEWVTLGKFVFEKKVILCDDSLAVGWGGIRNNNNLNREAIRTNLEWGANVITYCVCKDN